MKKILGRSNFFKVRLNWPLFFVTYSIVVTISLLIFLDNSQKNNVHKKCANENFKLYKVIIEQDELIYNMTHLKDWQKSLDSTRLLSKPTVQKLSNAL